MSLFLVLILSRLQNFEAYNFCRFDQFSSMWVGVLEENIQSGMAQVEAAEASVQRHAREVEGIKRNLTQLRSINAAMASVANSVPGGGVNAEVVVANAGVGGVK